MVKKPYPSETAERFIVRLPEGMRDRIRWEAEQNNRSMNAEVVARLQESFYDTTIKAREIVQALLMSEDLPRDSSYRKAIELRALLFWVGAPEQDLLAAMAAVNRLREFGRDYATESFEMLDRLELNLRPLLDTLAGYMRDNGWKITPPEEEGDQN